MVERRLLTSLICGYKPLGVKSRALLGLFFSIEVVDERQDEVSDQTNELNPILKIHAGHLLPSRKEADTSNCLLRNISHVHKFFNAKKSRSGAMFERLLCRLIQFGDGYRQRKGCAFAKRAVDGNFYAVVVSNPFGD